MKSTARCRRRRGIFLANMLLVLGLIAAFTVVASRLLRLSLQTAYQCSEDENDLLRLHQALAALRSDVWDATTLEVRDKSHLRAISGATDVEWMVTASGDLTRTAKDDRRQWAGLKVEFERQGIWLILRRGGSEIALLRQGGLEAGK